MELQSSLGTVSQELADLSKLSIKPVSKVHDEAATPREPSEAMLENILSNDPNRQLEAAKEFRKMLLGASPPVDQVIASGVVPRLAELLEADNATLQFEAAWALTNIASHKSEHVEAVIEAGAIPKLVRLLSSTSLNVREQATWALGNISGDSCLRRDLVLQSGALEPLLQILANDFKLSILKTASWTLSNFCRGKHPVPDWKLISPALPTLINLTKSPDEEILVFALWAISYLSDYHVEAFIKDGTCSILVAFLRHESNEVQTPALRAVGNIAKGTRLQSQVIVDCGVLPALLPLLSSSKNSIRKETCWTISNILADTVHSGLVQDVIDAGLIPPLIRLLKASDFKVRKEACWALANTTVAALQDVYQMHYMVSQGCIEPFCDMLATTDEKVLELVLDGLTNILKAGDIASTTGEDALNPYTADVEQEGGLVRMHAMRYHTNTVIGEKAASIVDIYFIHACE